MGVLNMKRANLLATLIVAVFLCAAQSHAGTLNVINGARYVGAYGLEVVVDDSNPAYVQDNTPVDEPRYRVRFYVRLTSTAMAATDEFDLFTAFANDDTPVFRLTVYFDGTDHKLRFTAREDGGSETSFTSGVVLVDGWRAVEVDWQAASSSGANDGILDLWVDGASQTGLSSLDNDTMSVDYVRWGAVDAIDVGTSGSFDLDEFESVRTNYIGLETVFADVPNGYLFQPFILAIYNVGVTAGCGNALFCPEGTTNRAQMAPFLLKSIEGATYSPPTCVSPTFSDVPCSHWAAAWIEELANRGITAGYGDGTYRPTSSVNRAQMAVFILKSLEGSSYTPPACITPTFTDVPCSYWAAAWIEELANRGITAGYGDGTYRPASPITRAQMATFLTKGFNFPTPVLN
jgi:hypothetical protein